MTFTIVQNRADQKLSQEVQSMPITFSFARWDKEQDMVIRLHEMVLCRDFLIDVIWANKTGKTAATYGFICNPKEVSIDKEQTLLLLAFPNASVKEIFIKNSTEILYDIETANSLRPTELVDGPDDYLLVIGDKFWQSKPFLISLYSLLLRCCGYDYKNVKDWRKEIVHTSTNESAYINSLNVTWDKFINKLHYWSEECGVDSFTGLQDTAHIREIHNWTGCIAVFGKAKYYSQYNKYAQKFLEIGGCC